MQPLPFLSHIPPERIRIFDSVGAWEADRQSRRSAGSGEIGGSLVAQILGLRPFGLTPWNAWLKLTGQDPPREESVQAVLNEGIRLEPIVAQEYARVAQPAHIWRFETGVIQVQGREPWAVVTPDGFTTAFLGGDGTDLGMLTNTWGGLELKTDRFTPQAWGKEPQVIERWSDEAAKIIPPSYACQCLLSMYCCELPFWDIAAWVPQSWGFPELRWHRLMRDADTERELIDTLGLWREKHIVKGEPPDIDDSAECRGFLTKLHPGPQGERKPMRVATPEQEAIVHEWIFATSRVAEAEGERDRLRNEVLAAIGDDYGLTVKNGKVIAFANHGRKSVDMVRLEKEYPEAYLALAREGTSFRTCKAYLK